MSVTVHISANPFLFWLSLVGIGLSTAQANCFCLQDDAMNIYKQCESFKRTTDPQPTFYCRNPHTGKDTNVTDGNDMKKIKAGDAGCSPCQHGEARSKPDVPRGD